MIQVVEEGLTFDDVLLVPKYSEIESRSKIDITVKLSKGIGAGWPLIPANMITVVGTDLIDQMNMINGLSIMHRFSPIEQQLDVAKKYIAAGWHSNVGFSVGVKPLDYESVDEFAKLGVRILCVDVAHGHNLNCIKMTNYIASKYPDIFLIAGNIATADGATMLWQNGADAVKCGVGSGSLCLTRIEAGAGYPQLSALSSVWAAKRQYEKNSSKKKFVISDGGATAVGSLVKALSFSDMIMSGHFFAGADETPGETIILNGNRYKRYVGSSTHKTNHIEGVEALVPIKGPVKDVIQKISEGLRSGMSYQGAKNLTELKQDPKFVRITNAGWKESGAHDVMVVK